MRAEEIREGDIVEIDYTEEFTKEHINEGKAIVIWKGNNSQPLVRKLNTRTTVWTSYEHIARVIGHIDIERYMDDALNNIEMKPEFETLDKLREEIEHRPYGIDNDNMLQGMKLQGMKDERAAILKIIDQYRENKEED